MIQLSPNHPIASLRRNEQSSIRLVSVVSGGNEFALLAEPISGVFQVPAEQESSEAERLVTPKGEMNIHSLVTCLNEQIGTPIGDTRLERTLISIPTKTDQVALRVQSVSRPIELSHANVFPLPRIANPMDCKGIIRGLAMVDANQSDPAQAFRLVIDPAAIFANEKPTQHASDFSRQPFRENDLSRDAQPEATLSRVGGADQVLIFHPDQNSVESLDYVFGLPIAMIAEVAAVPPIYNLPLTAPRFEGYAFWRKSPIPIIKLGDIFYDTCEPEMPKRHRDRRLIIARIGSSSYVGFLVKSQMQTMKTPSAEPIRIESLKNRPSLGIFRTQVGSIVVPNLRQILDSRRQP